MAPAAKSRRSARIAAAAVALLALIAWGAWSARVDRPLDVVLALPVAATPLSALSASEREVEPPGLSEPGAAGRTVPALLERESDVGQEASTAVVVHVRKQLDQSPIPGAEVVYFSGEDEEREFRSILEQHGIDPAEWRRAGRLALADSEGRVELQCAEGPLILQSASERHFGQEEITVVAGEPGSATLLCAPVTGVAVQVVDPRGRPCAGVPLVLRQARPSWFDLASSATTRGGDGLATFGVLPVLQGHERVVASVLGTFAEPVSAEFDLFAPPETPPRIVMPFHGSLEVRLVQPDGTPYEGSAHVALAPAGEDIGRESRPGEFASLGSGRALFQRVGLGLELVAGVRPDASGEWIEIRGPGPQVAGERAVLEALVPTMESIWIGRALDAKGFPLRRRELALEVRLEEGTRARSIEQRTTSDESGRFAVHLSPAPKGAQRCVLLVRDGNWRVMRGTVRVLTAKPGVVHLGDLRLGAPELLARGRVLDGAGAPAAQVRVDVLQPVGELGLAFASPAVTRESGEFEVLGWTTARTVTIHCTINSVWLHEPLELKRGTTDFVLRVP